MNTQLASKVLSVKVGNSTSKLVLTMLAVISNQASRSWPTYSELASICEIDKSSVMRHVKKLKSDGFLHIEKRRTTRGNQANVFTVLVPVDNEL